MFKSRFNEFSNLLYEIETESYAISVYDIGIIYSSPVHHDDCVDQVMILPLLEDVKEMECISDQATSNIIDMTEISDIPIVGSKDQTHSDVDCYFFFG